MKKMRKYVNLLAVLLVAFGFLFSFTACSDDDDDSTATEEDTEAEDEDTEGTDTEDTDTEGTDTEDTDYTEEYEIILAIERAINAGVADYWTLSDDETTYTCITTYTKDVTGSDEDSTVSYSVTINSGSYFSGDRTTSDDETVTTTTTKYFYDISAVVDGTDYAYVYSSTKIKTEYGDTYEVEYSYTITLNGKTIPGYEEYIEALETASSEEE